MSIVSNVSAPGDTYRLGAHTPLPVVAEAEDGRGLPLLRLCVPCVMNRVMLTHAVPVGVPSLLRPTGAVLCTPLITP